MPSVRVMVANDGIIPFRVAPYVLWSRIFLATKTGGSSSPRRSHFFASNCFKELTLIVPRS